MTRVYNRYQGNTGRVERVAEPHPPAAGAPGRSEPQPPQPGPPRRPVQGPPPGERRPPSPLSGLSGELGRLLKRLSPMKLETEDFLLIFILYLLYRESGDEEFLFAIGGLFLL